MELLGSLFSRNRAWAAAHVGSDPDFFSRLCDIHRPELLWIGCSDSRVPANEIVGLAPGELFVHRNVANVFPPHDPNATAVLDFAVRSLGVRHVIVCGHYRCGGVRAALQGNLDGAVGTWLRPVHDVAERHADDLPSGETFEVRWNRLCELNVAAQVRSVTATDIVRAAWERGAPLAVHGWIYDLRDGLLRDLGLTTDGESPPRGLARAAT